MKYLLVFMISMVPLVELRLAVPMALGMELPFWESLVVCALEYAPGAFHLFLCQKGACLGRP